MTDLESRHLLKEEMKDNSIEESMYNTLRGVSRFDAIVLRAWVYDSSDADDVSGRYMAARIRPLKIQNLLLPEPCSKKYDKYTQQCIVSLHPMAYSQSPVGTGGGLTVNKGDIVSCFWGSKSPQAQGKMKGLRFEFGKIHTNPGNIDVNCLEGTAASIKFPSGTGTEIERDVGDYSDVFTGPCRNKKAFWFSGDAEEKKRLAEEIMAAYPATKQTTTVGGSKTIAQDLVDFCDTEGSRMADPAWLANLIYMESSWRPTNRNPKSGATGIIQWMPKGAWASLKNKSPMKNMEQPYDSKGNFLKKHKNAWAAVDYIRKKSIQWQWARVKRRYRKYIKSRANGSMKYPSDIYLVTFLPGAIGNPLTFDMAKYWASLKKGRSEATFVNQNHGIRYVGDYVRTAKRKAEKNKNASLPTYLCGD